MPDPIFGDQLEYRIGPCVQMPMTPKNKKADAEFSASAFYLPLS